MPIFTNLHRKSATIVAFMITAVVAIKLLSSISMYYTNSEMQVRVEHVFKTEEPAKIVIETGRNLQKDSKSFKISQKDENAKTLQLQILDELQNLREFLKELLSNSQYKPISDVNNVEPSQFEPNKKEKEHSETGSTPKPNQRIPDKGFSAEAIPPKCACFDNITGNSYDLCFRGEDKMENVGIRMNCDNVRHLKNLNLFNETTARKIPLKMTENVTIVTAADNHHMKDVIEMLGWSLEKYPTAQLIFYDLGLNSNNRKLIKSYCNVQYRSLFLMDYPRYVKDPMQYRWKPIIIARAIEESNRSVILDIWMNKSVYATTNPGMYKYLPTNMETIKRIGSYGAGHAYFIRTAVSLRINFLTEYANCHRYDQSALNLILLHEYDMDPSKYGLITNLTLAETDHLMYVRGRRGGPAPKVCGPTPPSITTTSTSTAASAQITLPTVTENKSNLPITKAKAGIAEPPAEETPSRRTPSRRTPSRGKPQQKNPQKKTPPSEEPPAEKRPSKEPPAEKRPSKEPPAENRPSKEPPAEKRPSKEPPAEKPPAEQPPAEQPPAQEPPAEEAPTEQPPTKEPPAEEPPAEEPPAEVKPITKESHKTTAKTVNRNVFHVYGNS